MNKFKRITEKQDWHFVILALLLVSTNALTQRVPSILSGSMWGIGTGTWFWIGVLAAAVHQVYVILLWRTQLETQWLTKQFPRIGYLAYLIDFYLLLSARIAALVITAISGYGTFPVSATLRWPAALLIAIPFLWLLHSVVKYFGMHRAAGADHFDPDYQNKPFVRKGLFKITPNAIYVFGALGFYLPGLITGSTASLLLALFNHFYIWVHYFCTELPNIQRIYYSKSE